MNTYDLGVSAGKFYPFHNGHRLLIAEGLRLCRQLVVLVCETPGAIFSSEVRAGWIRETFAGEIADERLEVRIVRDPPPSNSSPLWARATIQWLGVVPDVTVTSEPYGRTWAAEMGCAHHQVDVSRTRQPVSGTAVRTAPLAHIQMLPPATRAAIARRVVFLGAESTGTSTLTRDVAEHYGQIWVPEFGRFWTEQTKISGDERWTPDEFSYIARVQNAHEDAAARSGTALVLLDTDALATCLWFERYFPGSDIPEDLQALGTARGYDLTILTSPEGVELEQDGWREGGAARLNMHERFRQFLEENGRPFVEVCGSRPERLEQARTLIDLLLVDRPLPHPLPERPVTRAT